VCRDVPDGKGDIPEVLVLSAPILPTWRGEAVGWSVMATVLAVNGRRGFLSNQCPADAAPI